MISSKLELSSELELPSEPGLRSAHGSACNGSGRSPRRWAGVEGSLPACAGTGWYLQGRLRLGDILLSSLLIPIVSLSL